MDTVGSGNNFAKQGQDLADKAAEKIQSGICAANDTGNQAADKLSDKIEDTRSSAGSTIGKAADQAQAVAKKTLDSVGEATQKVRAAVADVGNSVSAYAKDNPMKALLISAAVGAVVGAIATNWSRSRD